MMYLSNSIIFDNVGPVVTPPGFDEVGLANLPNGDVCWAKDMTSGQSLLCPSPENGVCPLFGGTTCHPTKDMCDEGKQRDACQIETLVIPIIIDFSFSLLFLVIFSYIQNSYIYCL